MPRGYIWVVFLLAAALCRPAHASTDIALNFTGTTSQILQGHSTTAAGSGTITPFGNAQVGVSANGLDVVTVSITVTLPSGDYLQATTENAAGAGNVVSGTATIVGATGQFSGLSGTLNFTFTVSPGNSSGTFTLTGYGVLGSGQQTLVVSQSGVRFQVTAGVQSSPPQTVFVSNPGAVSLTFTTAASTLSGNTSWLSAMPATGMSTTAAPAAVTIVVNPAGLAPGDYYGRVDIVASGAINSPQLIEVVLSVLPAGTNAPPVITPTGLIFVARTGSNPPAQTIQVTNSANHSLMLSTTVSFQQGAGWFSVKPASLMIDPAQTGTLTITVDPSSLSPGIYNGTLQIQDAGTASSYPVSILLVLLPQAPVAQSRLRAEASGGTCSPTALYPLFTLLANNFQTPAAFPAPMQVKIVDDCGQPMITGTVTATFSSGDPAVATAPIGSGQWAATWSPHSTAGAQVAITVTARLTSFALMGSTQVSGTVTPNNSTPLINAIGVVSAASFANVPVAPGSFISIFGSHLGNGLTVSTSLPLATTLGGTTALLGGAALPLQFASDGQINAIVPYDAPVNGMQQLLVQNNTAYSLPQPLSLAVAQPAAFTQQQTGHGAGIIVVVKPDQSQFLATPSTPATAGDALVIYCAGLGAVNFPVPAGAAAPFGPLSMTVNPVTVTIGGMPAQVLFSGLAPGFAGLYQVNAIVPSGVAAGSDVPVILTEQGLSSPPVTVAID